MKMKALLIYEPGNVKYEETDIRPLKPGEVLVKIDTALTCGTDIKTFKRGHPVLIKQYPSGFGHEFAGTVEEVGSEVTSFKPGQRVVAGNSAPCFDCYYCRIGRYNLCENLNFLNGAFAQYVIVPEQIVKHNLIEIADHVSFEEAAFTEPLSVVMHGAEKSDIVPGSTVGIIGLGPIGLLFVKVAKLMGARVIAMGRNPLKLKLAKEFGGADEVLNLRDLENPEKAIMDLTTEEKGLDVAIEAVGLPELWEKTLRITRRGGTVNLFGGCKAGSTIPLDTRRIHYDEIKIVSIFHHTPAHIRQALELITNGDIDVKKLITHTMPLSNYAEAFKLHDEGKAIKIALKPWE